MSRAEGHSPVRMDALLSLLRRLGPPLPAEGQCEEPVDCPVKSDFLDGHSRLRKPDPVGLALVPQRVVFGRQQERRWKAVEVAGPQG